MTWTLQERMRATAFVMLAVLIFAVPVHQVLNGSLRFGWQMFAAVHERPDFLVVDGAGVESAVDLERFTANLRGDIAFESVLPPHLCAVVDGTRFVMVKTGETTTEFQCP